MPIPFSKYEGCGNDFVLINNLARSFPSTNQVIRNICHRQRGIGADGLILVEPSQVADFRMRIFNADGSEAEMCGNGIRCLKKFLGEEGFNQPLYKIETMRSTLAVSSEGEAVKVEMPLPKDFQWNLSLVQDSFSHKGHALNTGVPHLVFFVPDLGQVPVEVQGPQLRHSPLFQGGTNVNWAQLIAPQQIAIRTYERGVEGETLACGTGATAVALAAAYLEKWPSPITVWTRSQERLTIEFFYEEERFSKVTLTGAAHLIFKGWIELEKFSPLSTILG